MHSCSPPRPFRAFPACWLPPVSLALGCLALAGCKPGDAGPLRVAMIAESGVDPVSLPDRKASAPVDMATPLRAATVEGLVSFDAEGRVGPALAERWIVTADGLGAIFRLREGTWADGTPLTAELVAPALRSALNAQHGTALGLDLAPIRAVRVMARRVIEIDLSSPLPDLLTLLAQPELGLVHGRHGTGPMGLRTSGAHRLLAMLPPKALGLVGDPDETRELRPIDFTREAAETAVSAFAHGDADLVFGGTVASLPLVPSLMGRGNLVLDPVQGLFGLLVNQSGGFLAEAPNREALAMAIDRDSLVAAFHTSGWQATTRIVAAGLEGDTGAVGERWTELSLDQRRGAAGGVVRGWQKAGKGTPTLTIALPEGPGSALVFERLKADFAAIGVNLVRLAPRVRSASGSADLVLIDRVARYARPEWYLDQLTCAVHPVACAPGGDARLADARMATDPRGRAQWLADAEAEITAANGFIPLARPLRWSLVRAGQPGFAPGVLGWHPLPPLVTTAP